MKKFISLCLTAFMLMLLLPDFMAAEAMASNLIFDLSLAGSTAGNVTAGDESGLNNQIMVSDTAPTVEFLDNGNPYLSFHNGSLDDSKNSYLRVTGDEFKNRDAMTFEILFKSDLTGAPSYYERISGMTTNESGGTTYARMELLTTGTSMGSGSLFSYRPGGDYDDATLADKKKICNYNASPVTNVLPAEEWTHLVVTRVWTPDAADPSVGKWSGNIYVNSEEILTVSYEGPLTHSHYDITATRAAEDSLYLFIGSMGGGTAFTGSIADYKVYNTAITDEYELWNMYTRAMDYFAPRDDNVTVVPTLAPHHTRKSFRIFDLELAGSTEEKVEAGDSSDKAICNTVTVSDASPTVEFLDNGNPYLTFHNGSLDATKNTYIKVESPYFESQDAMTFEILYKSDLMGASNHWERLSGMTTKATNAENYARMDIMTYGAGNGSGTFSYRPGGEYDDKTSANKQKICNYNASPVTGVLPANEWTHLVVTREWTADETNPDMGIWSGSIYVNGVKVLSKSEGGDVLTHAYYSTKATRASEKDLLLFIGSLGIGNAFTGSIADYKVYDIAIKDVPTINSMYAEAMSYVQGTRSNNPELVFDLGLDVRAGDEGYTLNGITNKAANSSAGVTYSDNLTAGMLKNGVPYVTLENETGTKAWIRTVDESYANLNGKTVEMMVRVNGTVGSANNGIIHFKRSASGLPVTSLSVDTQSLCFEIANTDVKGSIPHADLFKTGGEWMQLAFTETWNTEGDSVTGTLYINGKEVYTLTQAASRSDESGLYAVIGDDYAKNSGAMGLSVAECKIYNRALTEAELSENYASAIPDYASVIFKNPADGKTVAYIDGLTIVNADYNIDADALAELYGAFYDASDGMISASKYTADSKTDSIELNVAEGTRYIKVFMWEKDTLKPLSLPASIGYSYKYLNAGTSDEEAENNIEEETEDSDSEGTADGEE